jgi:hypothetical protein
VTKEAASPSPARKPTRTAKEWNNQATGRLSVNYLVARSRRPGGLKGYRYLAMPQHRGGKLRLESLDAVLPGLTKEQRSALVTGFDAVRWPVGATKVKGIRKGIQLVEVKATAGPQVKGTASDALPYEVGPAAKGAKKRADWPPYFSISVAEIYLATEIPALYVFVLLGVDRDAEGLPVPNLAKLDWPIFEYPVDELWARVSTSKQRWSVHFRPEKRANSVAVPKVEIKDVLTAKIVLEAEG